MQRTSLVPLQRLLISSSSRRLCTSAPITRVISTRSLSVLARSLSVASICHQRTLLRLQVRYNSSSTSNSNTGIENISPEMYTSDIVITDKAASRLAALAKDDSDPNLALRIIVESGGCHGFQYRFELTSERSSDDIVFTKDGGSVVVDNISIDYISGSTLDFVEELIGSTFKLTENPNAVSGCGCGTSFEIKI